MRLTLFGKLNCLSIESLFEKVGLSQLAVTEPHTRKFKLSIMSIYVLLFCSHIVNELNSKLRENDQYATNCVSHSRY